MMMSKDVTNWNIVNENNISNCLKIVKNVEFKQLHLSNEIQEFVSNISSNHKCDAKVLFYTILLAVSHFSEAVKVFNMESKQIKPISVYEVLIAPSGMCRRIQ